MLQAEWITEHKELPRRVHELISFIEDLNSDNDYSGSLEELYELIERCTIDRPAKSVQALIAYRLTVSLRLRHKYNFVLIQFLMD